MLDLDGIGRAFNYTLDALRSLAPAQIDGLSFVGFVERYGIAALDDLIPKNERYGKLDPPASRLTTGKLVRQWRRLGRSDQLYILDNPPAPVSRGSSRRASRRRHVQNPLTTADQNVSSNSQLVQLAVNSSASPGDAADVPLSPPGRETTAVLEPPPTIHPSTMHDVGNGIPCAGVTVELIRQSDCKDADIITKGFYHLVGNSLREKGHFVSNNQAWDYGSDTVGFLRDNNGGGGGDDKYTWRCKQVSDNVWSFHRRECLGTIQPQDRGCCSCCYKLRHRLFDMCRGEVEVRERSKNGGTIGGRRDYMKFKSPSIIMPRLELLGDQVHVL